MEAFMIGLALAFVGYLTKMQTKDFDGVVIRSPRYYFYVGIIGIICGVLIFLASYASPDSNSLKETILATFFLLSGIALTWQGTFWRIQVEDDQFHYTTYFRKTYTVKYEDIKSITVSKSFITIKTEEKTFYANPEAIGWDAFFEHIDDDDDDDMVF